MIASIIKNVGWNYFSISEHQRCSDVKVWEWISTLFPHFTCDYLSMLGLDLICDSKMGPWGAFQKR